jgi:hypothetical protein
MSFDDLVHGADRVVVGKVINLEGAWDEDMIFIHTVVTVAVERRVAGETGRQIQVRVPGGQVDGVGQVVHGAPSFQLGERVLLFLTTWEDGAAKVLGYVQGKSSVVPGDRGVPRTVGGVAGERSLKSVIAEITHGREHSIPLAPVRPQLEKGR